MTIEKTGDIKPDNTPDTEGRLAEAAEKRGTDEQRKDQSRKLDDDVTKRLSDAASG